MVGPERFVRRARQHLGEDEGVLGSVTGREADGRRRMAIVLTDQRVLLLTLRPEPPIVVPYEDLSVHLDTGVTASITLESGLATYGVEQIGDTGAAALVVELMGHRIAARTGVGVDETPRVRHIS